MAQQVQQPVLIADWTMTRGDPGSLGRTAPEVGEQMPHQTRSGDDETAMMDQKNQACEIHHSR